MSEKCKYFGNCGGCQAQHIDYSVQLENKKKVLQRITEFEDVKVFSGKDYHYRNRMDFIFTPIGLGFRKKGNWKQIINVDECLIANEKINELLKEINSFFKSPDSFNIFKQNGTFKYALIRTSDSESSISFVLNQDSTTIEDATRKIKKFSKITTATNVLVTYVPKKTDMSISEEYYVVKGNDYLTHTYLGKSFNYSVQGFFQNNHEVALKLQEYCRDIFKKYETKGSYLLDLYGGVGTFGIINSDLFKKVLTVESFKGCTVSAKENILQNGLKNVEAYTKDAKQFNKLDFKKPLYVLIDPPRCGLDLKAIRHLNEESPEVIVYVSCNVTQMSKEIRKFKGYKLKSVAMFDLFPQTPHAEGVVELVKEK